jgi:hypothetical protein
MSDNSGSSNGVGLTTLLTVLFVGLKLTDNIDWSWWWVLSPLWISGLIALVCLSIGVLIAIFTD